MIRQSFIYCSHSVSQTLLVRNGHGSTSFHCPALITTTIILTAKHKVLHLLVPTLLFVCWSPVLLPLLLTMWMIWTDIHVLGTQKQFQSWCEWKWTHFKGRLCISQCKYLKETRLRSCRCFSEGGSHQCPQGSWVYPGIVLKSLHLFRRW